MLTAAVYHSSYSWKLPLSNSSSRKMPPHTRASCAAYSTCRRDSLGADQSLLVTCGAQCITLWYSRHGEYNAEHAQRTRLADEG